MPRVLAQEGNLVCIDFGGPGPLLNKRQLAAALGYSRRWVELRCREGMPSHLDGNRRMFSFPEVRRWLQSQGRRAADG